MVAWCGIKVLPHNEAGSQFVHVGLSCRCWLRRHHEDTFGSVWKELQFHRDPSSKFCSLAWRKWLRCVGGQTERGGPLMEYNFSSCVYFAISMVVQSSLKEQHCAEKLPRRTTSRKVRLHWPIVMLLCRWYETCRIYTHYSRCTFSQNNWWRRGALFYVVNIRLYSEQSNAVTVRPSAFTSKKYLRKPLTAISIWLHGQDIALGVILPVEKVA